MRLFLLLTLVALSFCNLPAQQNRGIYFQQITVINDKDGSPLAYANVYNKRSGIGTPTNEEGYFELPGNKHGDTIVVSYLGFEDYLLVLTNRMQKTILLRPSPDQLSEVTVTADNGYLYDLVLSARKNSTTPTKEAKTYFYLETKVRGEYTEIIEAFYNGTYADFGLHDLQFKKGRVGLKPVGKRYFHSTESSKLFSTHNLFERSTLFPDSPLSIRRGALRKRYRLSLANRFSENGADVYAISFEPSGAEALFSGTVWIDRTNNRIRKVSLSIKNSRVHPFTKIGLIELAGTDMNITRTYSDLDQNPFLDGLDFNYTIRFTDDRGGEHEAFTKAYSKAYDYGQPFDPPRFSFTKAIHEDYRNIIFTPYDSVFWKGTDEFRFYDRLEQTEDFIFTNRTENNVLFSRREESDQQLQWPYIVWNEGRFKMTQAPESKINPPAYLHKFQTERFQLGIKLYLDVNYVRDAFTYQLLSVLDPAETYYHFYMGQSDQAFLNMSFDLMEIQRRALDAELGQLTQPTIAELETLYQQYVAQFEKEALTLLRETNRGTNLRAMASWNDYILSRLSIDNLKLFGLKDIRDGQ